jgi:hypothetical protein
MKAYALFLACLLLASPALAQQSPADTPATKEDIEKCLQAMQTRETMQKMMDVMAKQLHQFTHQQFETNATKLPPDFEERMNRITDDMLKTIPLDEMIDLMIPVYQKHLTKADVDAMVAFYSTPTGQKLIRDMPAIMQEAMQAYMPFIQKYMTKIQDRVRTEIVEMVKEAGDKPQPQRP